MQFSDIKNDTPRLAVMYDRRPDGSEQFRWGLIGSVPVLSLIGYVFQVQADIVAGKAENHDCPESAFVIVWDGKEFDWFVHRDVPVHALVGMLEAVKRSLMNKGTPKRASSPILGPDGSPMGG